MATETNEPRALTAALACARVRHAWRRAGDARRQPARRALGARGRGRGPVRPLRSLGSSIGWSRRGSRPRSARPRCGCSASTRATVLASARAMRCRGCSRVRGTRTSSTGWPPRARSAVRCERGARRRRVDVHDARHVRSAARSGRSELAAPPTALPTALYEYVAPSLSITSPAAPAGVGHGGSQHEPYSPLVPLAAIQAADLMSRAVSPLLASSSGGPAAPGRMSPACATCSRPCSSGHQARVAAPEPTRLAMQAPELVTPPAPRAD